MYSCGDCYMLDTSHNPPLKTLWQLIKLIRQHGLSKFQSDVLWKVDCLLEAVRSLPLPAQREIVQYVFLCAGCLSTITELCRGVIRAHGWSPVHHTGYQFTVRESAVSSWKFVVAGIVQRRKLGRLRQRTSCWDRDFLSHQYDQFFEIFLEGKVLWLHIKTGHTPHELGTPIRDVLRETHPGVDPKTLTFIVCYSPRPQHIDSPLLWS